MKFGDRFVLFGLLIMLHGNTAQLESDSSLQSFIYCVFAFVLAVAAGRLNKDV